VCALAITSTAGSSIRALPLVRQLVAADLAARAESVARVDELIAQHNAGG